MRWILTGVIYFYRKLLRLLGASTVGVRALVINDQNKVLLVKHIYGKGWHLPGGGVEYNETPYAAIQRELQEEVGIVLNEEPILFDIYHHLIFGMNDYPIIFVVKNFKQNLTHDFEIKESGWFAQAQLPEDIQEGTLLRIQEYFEKINKSRSWK